MSLLLLLLLGSLMRSGIQGMREWFAANSMMVVALPLILARGRIPDALSVVAANMLMALSGAALYAGTARFLGCPPRWPALLSGVLAVSGALVYWCYVVDSIPVRVLVTSLFTTVICAGVAVLLLRHRPPGLSPYPRWITLAMALVFGACQAARGIYFMTLEGPSSPLMFASPVSVLLLVIDSAIMPVMSMSVIMMVHDALLANARDAANRDHLTGALSRKGLEAAAAKRIADAARDGWPLSLLVIDLDHFKSINDTFGHAGGDSVLQAFTRLARTQLRRGDVLGRMGGEEFAILLPQASGAQAVSLAERLRAAVAAQAVTLAGGTCHYTLSAGVAEWQRGESFDRLSMRADLALYRAKRTGRDRVCAEDADAMPPAQSNMRDGQTA